MARDFASSLFDLADGAIDVIASMGPSDRRPDAGRSIRRRTGPAPRARLASGSESSGSRERYRVVESLDAQTGAMCWVVTDGIDRAECGTAQFAQKVKAALG